MLPELAARLPTDFAESIRVYSEPFVGGGALLWRILSYPNRLERVIVNDLNPDLANAYRVIQSQVGDIIDALKALQQRYKALSTEELRKEFFLSIGVKLVDFKLEFGRLPDGTIVLADEISPDTCRFWDAVTNEKLDKDRFRRDLGNVEGAYAEMEKRVFGA